MTSEIEDDFSTARKMESVRSNWVDEFNNVIMAIKSFHETMALFVRYPNISPTCTQIDPTKMTHADLTSLIWTHDQLILILKEK